MRSVAAVVLFASAARAPTASAQDSAKKAKAVHTSDASKPPKEAKPYASSALFRSDSILRLTIVGDWRALGGDRDTVNPKLRPGTLVYTDTGGRVVRIPVHLSTRGHFRLSRATCSFPPLRVSFDSAGTTKHTLFAGQSALKLGTHCVDTGLYDQYVLREYLVDKAHTLITPMSLRARLARVRYVDSRDTNKVVERWGLWHESERELGERLGGKVLQARGGLYRDVVDSSAVLLGVWEYFIGNTDFSMAALHNVRLVATPAGVMAVPYDFDFSGLVDTRYSAPDPRLNIRSVRQRLYRGPCLTEAQLAPVLARFAAQRDSIRGLYETLEPLDRGYAKQSLNYIDDFYKDATDARKFARMIKGTCDVGS
jgi:hypothetical protein